jgi:hypothetical protein
VGVSNGVGEQLKDERFEIVSFIEAIFELKVLEGKGELSISKVDVDFDVCGFGCLKKGKGSS